MLCHDGKDERRKYREVYFGSVLSVLSCIKVEDRGDGLHFFFRQGYLCAGFLVCRLQLCCVCVLSSSQCQVLLITGKTVLPGGEAALNNLQIHQRLNLFPCSEINLTLQYYTQSMPSLFYTLCRPNH